MFQKLIAIIIISFTVQFISAEATISEPNYVRDHDEEYKDGKYNIHIQSIHALNPGQEQIEMIYRFFFSKDGAQKTAEFARSFQYPETPLKYVFYLPNEATVVLVYIGSEEIGYKISVERHTKALQGFSIDFTATGKPENVKRFLSSPVAKRAFKKAGITLTKEQVENLVVLQ